MDKQLYEKISQPFRENKILYTLLMACNTIPTGIGYIFYPILLIYLCFTDYHRIPAYIFFPGLFFVCLSIVRNKLSYSRPYEVLDIKPLIKKDTKGKSFPSRHAFSIFLIGTLWLPINLYIGIFILICGIILCIARVIGGIHFTTDVIVGMILGMLSGIFTIMI
ncbi:MAG: phosphatase PAP2 family protein [Holdemanella sp.]|nr:phosphatase PAP2 family protein [Holdemanella sp.]